MSGAAGRIHVLFYLRDLGDGGVQKRTLRMLDGLRRYGGANLRLTLLVANGGGVMEERVPSQVAYHPLGTAGGRWRRLPLLVREMQRLRPDLTVCCMGQEFIALSLAQRCLGMRVPAVVVQAIPPRLPGVPAWIGHARELLMRSCYRQAAAVVGVSHEIARLVGALSPMLAKRTLAINNPVVEPSIRERAREPVDHPFFAVPDATVFVAVGRLHIQKNYPVLIDALMAARDRSSRDLRLVIIGEGPERRRIEERIATGEAEAFIDLVGHQSNPYPFMRRAQAVVMPSLWEGLPNALIEALAIGAPVIATDCPTGPAEILEGGRWGRLLPVDDGAALRDALIEAADDNPAAGREERQNRGDSFSVRRSALRYRGLFARLSHDPSALHSRNPMDHRPRILGVPLDPRDIPQLHAEIHSALREQRRLTIVSQNLHGIAMYHRHPEVRALHRRALVRVDGMPVLLWARLMGYRVRHAQRVTWVDWLPHFCAMAQRRQWRVFYLGSTAAVLESGLERLRSQYPGLVIDGHHGHFPLEGPEAAAIAERINQARPDLLLVGMGMPRQERWVLAWRERLSVPVVLTCGAAIEYVAAAQAPPPRILGAIGLEWLHRLASQPRRLGRRYLIEPWSLLGYVLRDLGARISGRQPHPRDREAKR